MTDATKTSHALATDEDVDWLKVNIERWQASMDQLSISIDSAHSQVGLYTRLLASIEAARAAQPVVLCTDTVTIQGKSYICALGLHHAENHHTGAYDISWSTSTAQLETLSKDTTINYSLQTTKFFVNNRDFITHETYLRVSEIKSLIGVPLDYELFEISGNQTISIGNEQNVFINPGARFRAIPAGTFGSNFHA